MLRLRLILLFLLPVLVLGRLWAMVRGRENLGDLRSRLRGTPVRPGSIWFHAASVGEVTSIKSIVAAMDDTPILVTTNSVTARARVRSWGLAHVTAELAPLDFSGPARRMVARARALILVESELWPNRLSAAHQCDVPVILLSARMSDRSAKGWARLGRAASELLAGVRLAIPQDATSADNLIRLGVPAQVMRAPVMLKSAYVPDRRAIPPDLIALKDAPVILAAATHPGEDEIVLAAFQQVRAGHEDLRLILAPRHPDRGDALRTIIEASGLSVAQRSRGEAPDQTVYLADTLGEMSFWYRLANLTFVGGSLVDKGGHTPFEPIAYDCPILHGPHTGNFSQAYATLGKAKGAILVTDVPSLAVAIEGHIGDHAMADRARRATPVVDLSDTIAEIRTILSGPSDA